MKVLIDADLILELLINRSEVVKDAEVIWKLAKSQNIEAFVTNAGLEKIYFFCRELTDENRAGEIVWSLEKVLSSCNLDQNIIRKATSSQLKDFESAIEITCVKYMGFDGVVTHCLQNFSGSDSSVWSIHELLTVLKNNEKNRTIKTTKKLTELYKLENREETIKQELNTYNTGINQKIIPIKLPQTAVTKKDNLENIKKQANTFEAEEKRNWAVKKNMRQKVLRLFHLRFRQSILTVVLLIIILIVCILLLTGKVLEAAIITKAVFVALLTLFASSRLKRLFEKF
ncbi:MULTISPECIES: PIN domain-containing protein [unclassified Nostoc]|uniref:PIN domain-containing protein n=1 Tax=unclassified Nostoc TaxID=2593658 RepID=UPI002AD3B124|nr:PIN domain-containing protein [Nostoc sp. DedQUE03]MDZ7976433.1 PIN domain-containing protein [Nostoc sp. DedQUE03]MDZ8042758.1 PIN domain-containing protein [Nostoc sp. DedQUE02]